jgi:hypothetical protein
VKKPKARASCSFPLAIVKGLVEHGDGRRYFGSTLSFSGYADDAISAGWLKRDAADHLELTDAGRTAYRQLKLDALPRTGRAYTWDWSVVAEATEIL